MRDRIIRLGSFISIIVMIVICTYILIVQDSINRNMVMISIFGAFGIGLLVSIIYRLVLYFEESHLRKHNLEIENEIILLQGIVYLRQEKGSIIGMLMLTSDKLIFSEVNGCKYLYLKDISRIEIKKRLGFLNTGLIISDGDTSYVYEIDYPSDWKALIDRQKSFNRSNYF